MANTSFPVAAEQFNVVTQTKKQLKHNILTQITYINIG